MKHLLVKGTPTDFHIGFFLNPKTDSIEYTKNPKGISLRGTANTIDPKELIRYLKEDVMRRVNEFSSFSLQVFSLYWFITIEMTIYKAEVYLLSECSDVNSFWITIGIAPKPEEIIPET
jgi:hypothetical protein